MLQTFTAGEGTSVSASVGVSLDTCAGTAAAASWQAMAQTFLTTLHMCEPTPLSVECICNLLQVVPISYITHHSCGCGSSLVAWTIPTLVTRVHAVEDEA